MTDALEPERQMQREDSQLPSAGSLGLVKMNFLKAPPPPWHSGISNLRSLHWVDTDPWLWAEGGQGLITFSSLEGPLTSSSTGCSTIPKGGEMPALFFLLLLLIVVGGVAGKGPYQGSSGWG